MKLKHEPSRCVSSARCAAISYLTRKRSCRSSSEVRTPKSAAMPGISRVRSSEEILASSHGTRNTSWSVVGCLWCLELVHAKSRCVTSAIVSRRSGSGINGITPTFRSVPPAPRSLASTTTSGPRRGRTEPTVRHVPCLADGRSKRRLTDELLEE
eukprot:scaffold44240_cov59-Phaeocystis_antarctica.AAC.3